MMTELNRRNFIVTGSAGAIFSVAAPRVALSATECLSLYVPGRLTVDCASRQNFAMFRKNSSFVGLAGVVSMTNVVGKFGKYPAGSLFLFPWLKPRGDTLGLTALFPTSATTAARGVPLTRASVADEVFCGNVLQAPRAQFIGFVVNVPYDRERAKSARFTNVVLADRMHVGINWTSSNLNDRYFAGSRIIPHGGVCNGGTWRKLIVDGLHLASKGAC
jgi:hypothetical protein